MNDSESWSLARPMLSVSVQAVEVGVLRVLRDDADAAAVLGKEFGFGWPMEPNTTAGGATQAAWLAPGEWAIFGPRRKVAEKVAKACANRTHHYADESTGRNLWCVTGSSSRGLLASACSLDLHPRAFQPRRCARTLVAQVPVLIIKADDPDEFRILADASLAGHLQAWFDDAAKTDFR